MAIFDSNEEAPGTEPTQIKKWVFIVPSLLIVYAVALLRSGNPANALGYSVFPMAMAVFLFYLLTYIPNHIVARTIYVILFIGVLYLFFS